MLNLRVKQTDWYVSRGKLLKYYNYLGVDEGGGEHTVRIDVDRSVAPIGGFVNAHVAVVISPHLWPGMPEGHLAAQLGFANRLAEAPCVMVWAGNCDDGSLLIQVCEQADAATFVDVLRQGKAMHLALLNKYQLMLRLPIPEDDKAPEAFDGFIGSKVRKGGPTQSREKRGFWERLVLRQE